ncbi:MAG: hypothetical protein ACO3NK_01745 [Prochlorotrichaceae cyanobacterium]|jgi:hypothetical protein
MLLKRGGGLVALSLVGLVACQSSPKVVSESDPQAPVEASTSPDAPALSDVANHQDLLRSIPSWEARSYQGIPYTSPNDRLRQVEVGRADPFAPTETIVVNVQTVEAPAAKPATQVASPSQIASLPAIPVMGVTNPLELQPLNFSPVPVSVPPAPSTTLAAPEAPIRALSPTHLADQMQVKGVVEVNQKWQAIVWEPQTSLSKTVQAGDVLGNGQVTVRRIEQTSNGLLRIVLEQNGIEVIHTVS